MRWSTPTTARPVKRKRGRSPWRARAEALWALLDDIDTLDDAVKANDVAYRKEARRIANRRHEILVSDGYALTAPPRDKPRGGVVG